MIPKLIFNNKTENSKFNENTLINLNNSTKIINSNYTSKERILDDKNTAIIKIINQDIT